MPYESKDTKSDDRNEEVIGENMLPEFFDYITSSYFESQLDEFCEKHSHEFEQQQEAKSEYKSIDISHTTEFTHEHKAIFDEYQALVDKLLSSFAKDHRMDVGEIYECCRDTGPNMPFLIHFVI